MEINIEVKRIRPSVTQGEAHIYANGKFIINYGDKIEINGQYGQVIGGWGSTITDKEFIVAALKKYADEIYEACNPYDTNDEPKIVKIYNKGKLRTVNGHKRLTDIVGVAIILKGNEVGMPREQVINYIMHRPGKKIANARVNTKTGGLICTDGSFVDTVEIVEV